MSGRAESVALAGRATERVALSPERPEWTSQACAYTARRHPTGSERHPEGPLSLRAEMSELEDYHLRLLFDKP